MNVFQKIKASLRLDEAVKKAEQAHRETGARYYVMPVTGSSGRLIVMDRFNFRKLKQKGYIPRHVFIRDLEIECFYFTAYRDGASAITPQITALKRKQFYQWYADCVKKPQKGKRQWAGLQRLNKILTAYKR